MVRDCRFINADGLALAYRDWGEGPRTLLCVHGLYRNSHDFDYLAAALSETYRVIAVDMIGRGGSDRSPDPDRYNAPFYARDVMDLAAALGLRQFDYLGTSMGGTIGMLVGASPESPIRKLILNDIGPEITLAKLRELGRRALAAPQNFASYAEAMDFSRRGLASWGPLSDEQREHLARHNIRQRGGRWEAHYDPRLVEGYRWPEADVDLWPVYRMIRGPVLVLRGADSDVLAAETAERLRADPKTTVVEIPGTGHAPALVSAKQIGVVRRFLDA